MDAPAGATANGSTGQAGGRSAASPDDIRPVDDTRLVIAILGGLVAAFCWATATLSSTRSSRMIGAASVLAWVMIAGALAALGPSLAVRPDRDLTPFAWTLAVVQGASYVGGLFLAYSALRRGRVGIVAPILSTEGAIAAVIAIALGETLGAAGAVLLVVIVVGVILAATPGSEAALEPVLGEGESDATSAPTPLTRSGRDDRTAVGLAVAAAGIFGIGLVTSALAVGEGVPVAWVALIARLVGVVAVAIPLAISRRLRLVRAAAPLVVAAGVLEVIGTAAYTVGAQDGIAVAAIVSAQFAAIAAVGGYLLFGERLHRVQLAGASLIVVGVSVLTAIRV